MEDPQPKNQKSWVSALSLALQLGYTIAIPLVFLALIGRYLDKKFDTSPWLLLAAVLLSLIITSWIIFVKINKIMTDLGKCERKVKKLKKEE